MKTSLHLLFSALVAAVAAHAGSSAHHHDFQHIRRAQQELTSAQENLIKTRLARNSKDSWVSGTRAEALLEFDTPELSVFSSGWTDYFTKSLPTRPSDVISIARGWEKQLTWDSPTFVGDQIGAAGDPASIGVAFLWAAVTNDQNNAYNYEHAMHKQKEFLQYTVPRLSDGTMSQRATWEPVQLWDDFVYMAPPYLALYGVYFDNEDMIKAAYNQCSLYRKHMQDSDTKFWHHVLLGDWQDTTFWGTGMGWAAAGMTRVAATLKNSNYSSKYSSQINNLTSWAMEIIDATAPYMDSGLLPNKYKEGTTFREASHSAMIASSIYRLASMGVSGASDHISQANRIRRAVYRGISSKTGWNSPVVDPLEWDTEVHQSPEAIAFILIMEAAWRAYSG